MTQKTVHCFHVRSVYPLLAAVLVGLTNGQDTKTIIYIDQCQDQEYVVMPTRGYNLNICDKEYNDEITMNKQQFCNINFKSNRDNGWICLTYLDPVATRIGQDFIKLNIVFKKKELDTNALEGSKIMRLDNTFSIHGFKEQCFDTKLYQNLNIYVDNSENVKKNGGRVNFSSFDIDINVLDIESPRRVFYLDDYQNGRAPFKLLKSWVKFKDHRGINQKPPNVCQSTVRKSTSESRICLVYKPKDTVCSHGEEWRMIILLNITDFENSIKKIVDCHSPDSKQTWVMCGSKNEKQYSIVISSRGQKVTRDHFNIYATDLNLTEEELKNKAQQAEHLEEEEMNGECVKRGKEVHLKSMSPSSSSALYLEVLLFITFCHCFT